MSTIEPASESASESAGQPVVESGRRGCLGEQVFEGAAFDMGGYIRAQREFARMSLRHLARMTKVSDSYLSQVERGLYQPSPEVLRAIAVGLGLEPDHLFRRMGWWSQSASSGVGVIEAIAADTRLSGSQKAALRATYRAMVGG